VKRSSFPRLHISNLAKFPSVPLIDGLSVVSRGDVEGPCSEAQSTERAALYDSSSLVDGMLGSRVGADSFVCGMVLLVKLSGVLAFFPHLASTRMLAQDQQSQANHMVAKPKSQEHT
jgi:hypothetical protein